MRLDFGRHVSYAAQMLHFVQHDKKGRGVSQDPCRQDSLSRITDVSTSCRRVTGVKSRSWIAYSQRRVAIQASRSRTPCGRAWTNTQQ